MDRRAVLKSALIVAGAPLASQLAWAQEFPNRTIRIVVPYAPGGASDVLSRAVPPRRNRSRAPPPTGTPW
jgi:tripartite-type tricarboxylate transporter receptor subunit TctC